MATSPQRPLPTAPVVLTGSRGRLASHLAGALSDAGVDVLRVSRSPGEGHISYDEMEASNVLGRAAALIHCAWSSLPVTAETHPASVQSEDLPLLGRLMSEIGRRPDPEAMHFIFLSSGGAIYGECEEPAVETTPPAPVGNYGRGKALAEEMLSANRGAGSPNLCILRPSNPYGFRFVPDKPQGVVGAALHAVRTDEPLKLLGGGASLKDFLHIDDFERAIMDCLRLRLSGVYNICSGASVRTLDIIHQLEKAGGFEVPRIDVPAAPWDVHRSLLSRGKFTAATGWEPGCSLHEGLRRALREAGFTVSG